VIYDRTADNLKHGVKIEETCRFKLKEDVTPEKVTVRSNFFALGNTYFSIELTVNRQTGLLIAQVIHPYRLLTTDAYGAITPFGIILNEQYGEFNFWHFYWKQLWSKSFVTPARPV